MLAHCLHWHIPLRAIRVAKMFMVSMNSGLMPRPLINKLIEHDMRLIDIRSLHAPYVPVNIVWTDGDGVDKRIYKVNCDMKNHLNGCQGITDKLQLHEQSTLQPYLAPTIIISNADDMVDMDTDMMFPAIIRPNMGFAGKGISVIDNMSQLPAAIEKAKRETKPHTKILISKYWQNLWLLDGKKCHARMYFMLYCAVGGKRGCSVWHRGKVFTSKLKFNASARDRDHFDTHNDSTVGDIRLSDLKQHMTLASYEHVTSQMRDICQIAAECVLNDVAPYSESAYGFEILAADFIILDDFSVKLIEINDKVGYAVNGGPDYAMDFSKEYFDWVWDVVLQLYIDTLHI